VTAILLACVALQGGAALVAVLVRRSALGACSLVPLLITAYFVSFPLVFFGFRRVLYPAYPFMALSLAMSLAWCLGQWRRVRGG
jgi:hypothetical protein